MSPSTGV